MDSSKVCQIQVLLAWKKVNTLILKGEKGGAYHGICCSLYSHSLNPIAVYLKFIVYLLSLLSSPSLPSTSDLLGGIIHIFITEASETLATMTFRYSG